MGDMQGDFGNLVHGVSSQPDERKFKGQGREQINCRSNLTTGLERRGAFKFIDKLASTEAEVAELIDGKFVIMESEPYPVVVAFGVTQPQAWGLDGSPLTVNIDAEGLTYYQHSVIKPLNKRFFEHSVLDTMFVSNTEFQPTVTEVTGDTPPRGVWVEFSSFQPGADAQIQKDGVDIYTCKVFDGYVTVNNDGDIDRNESVRTEEYSSSWHALRFVEGDSDADNPSPPNPGFLQYNGWVFIPDDLGDYRVIQGAESISIHVTEKITAIEKLPPFAIDGVYAVVEEGVGEDQNKGYFEARTDETTFGVVSWHEVVKFGEGQAFVESTMPHRFYRTSPDVFDFGTNSWSVRQVGDVDSNPLPEFILATMPIDTLTLFQNRLMMTSGEVVAASATDSYYDFFAGSAFYNTDDDPFEAFATGEKINNIKASVQHDGDFILFSENAQFRMSGDINHTYATAYIQPIGHYKSNLDALPVPTGNAVLFGYQYGSFAGVREMYTSGATEFRKAEPITTHVNDYIRGTVSHMTTSTNVDALVCLATEDIDTIFVYEFIELDGEKAQQSWSKWILPEGVHILWVEFHETDLYAVAEVIIESGERELHLFSLNWDDVDTGGLHFPVKLDGLHAITEIAYDSALNISSWVTGVQRLDFLFVEDGTEDPGFVVEAEVGPDGYTWTSEGDLSGATLWAGIPFESGYDFANPVIRDSNDVAMSLDRVQLGQMYLHFTTVGQVSFTYGDSHGRSKTLNYNNRRINRLNNEASYIPTEASDWRIAIRKKVAGLTMRLHTKDVTPFTLRAAEYRGDYKQRGGRR